METYKTTTIGISLTDALDFLKKSDEYTMSDELIKVIYKQFTNSLIQALGKTSTTANIKGNIIKYNRIDDVWNLAASNLTVVINNKKVTCQNVNIIMCEAPK